MTSNNKIKQAHKSQNFSPHTRPEALADDLARVVRGDVFADIVHRAAYSTDASPYRILPECVVVPRDSSDIVAAVKYAGARGMPVAARGGASGVAGESLCSGIVFDMTRYMNRIISVQNSGETVVCEPGVILQELNNYLSAYGRKIGPDPSSRDHATVGGCVANNATGAHSLQYGYTAAYVESVEAVLADGSLVEISNNFDPENSEHEPVTSIAKQCLEILSPNQELIRRSQPRTRRNRSGYNIAGVCHDGRIDLARMLTGSEGTLAVFTKIKLRTVPLPEAKGLLQLEFDSLRKMSQAVPIIVDSGAVACELMDKTVIDLAIDSLPEYQDILPARAAAVLLVEHIGQTQQQVRGKIARTVSAVGALAYEKRIFLDDGQQTRIWKSRKDAGPLLCRLTDTRQPTEFMEDVSVPNDQLLAYITGLQKIAKKYDIVMPYYGHAGDGELHIRPYLDLSEPDGIEKFQRIAKEVFELAWSLGGSISGEHADGLVRAGFVKRQYGSEYYQLLVQIKKAFDPQGVLNPGKILNDDPDIMVKNLRARHKILPERLQTQMLFDKNELLVDLERCYGCGLCRGREAELRMCPVFRALGEEIGSTRSKANLLRFWAAGQISKEDFESPQFRKFLDLCVNCKACSFECPSGVDISELICVVRSAYVSSRGLRRAERVLSNNRYLSMLGSVFSPLSNLFMALPPLKWLLEKLTGLDRHRSMPKFNHGSFLKAGRKYLEACEAINKPVDKVAYFVVTVCDHKICISLG